MVPSSSAIPDPSTVASSTQRPAGASYATGPGSGGPVPEAAVVIEAGHHDQPVCSRRQVCDPPALWSCHDVGLSARQPSPSLRGWTATVAPDKWTSTTIGPNHWFGYDGHPTTS